MQQETDTVSPVVLTELKAEITEDGLRLKLTGTIADENLKSYTVQTGKADETNQMKNPMSIAVGTESVVDAGIAD